MPPQVLNLHLEQLSRMPPAADKAGSAVAVPALGSAATPQVVYQMQRTQAEITGRLDAAGCTTTAYPDQTDRVICWMSVVKTTGAQLDAIAAQAEASAKQLATTGPVQFKPQDRADEAWNVALRTQHKETVRVISELASELRREAKFFITTSSNVAILMNNYREIERLARDAIANPNATQAIKDDANLDIMLSLKTRAEVMSRIALPIVDQALSALDMAQEGVQIMNARQAALQGMNVALMQKWREAIYGWQKTAQEFSDAMTWERGISSFVGGLLGAPGQLIGKTGDGIGDAVAGILGGTGRGVQALGKGTGYALLWLIPGVLVLGGVGYGIYYAVNKSGSSRDHDDDGPRKPKLKRVA